MYRSPIEIFYQNVHAKFEKKLDSDICTAVMKYGIHVDKEELIRALKYDRGQFEKGYMDGRADARKEIVHCRECKHYRNDEGCTPHCYKYEGLYGHPKGDDFCSYGERRCDNEVD